MAIDVDSAGWSGEGEFTQKIIERLRAVEHLTAVKVEDAPATRSDADYNFVANEIFVTFATAVREERTKLLGFIPGSKRVTEKRMTLAGLAALLQGSDGIGPADYGDEGSNTLANVAKAVGGLDLPARLAESNQRLQACRAGANLRSRHAFPRLIFLSRHRDTEHTENCFQKSFSVPSVSLC